MNLLEIVLAFISLLYAFILYRALTNIDITDKKLEIIYKNMQENIGSLGQKHNAFVDKQVGIIEDILSEVDKRLESASTKQIESHKSFLGELEQVKKFISQGFLRR